jgi:chromosomal replication initiator protein
MAVQAIHSSVEEIDRLWTQVLGTVYARIGSAQTFETWFRPIVVRSISPEVVELEVPNAFFVDWIHEHHLPLLRDCVQTVLGGSPEIRLLPREIEAEETRRPAPPLPPVATATKVEPRRGRSMFMQ